MKITPKNYARKFQEGGAMEEPTQAAPEEAPEASQQDPIMALAQMAAQALQAQDCNMAMQVCQAFLQVIQQMQGGGGEPQGEPVFRKGGILSRRIKK